MAKEKKSNRYQGVYYRDLDNGDRSYFLRVRLGGGTKRIPIGKRSEGITEAFCNQEEGTAHEQKVLIHTLRHSVATQQLSKGVPLEVISKTLDHSSFEYSIHEMGRLYDYGVHDYRSSGEVHRDFTGETRKATIHGQGVPVYPARHKPHKSDCPVSQKRSG